MSFTLFFLIESEGTECKWKKCWTYISYWVRNIILLDLIIIRNRMILSSAAEIDEIVWIGNSKRKKPESALDP